MLIIITCWNKSPSQQPISRYYETWPFLSIFRTLAKVLHIKSPSKYCIHPSPPHPKTNVVQIERQQFEKPVTSFLSARQHRVNLPAAFTPRRSPSRDSPFKRFLGIDISPGYRSSRSPAT
ncbi:hypothetical protein CEXT_710211 [Caerostris extrusa]|uniref:Uncharacterized protein n=1 Tax=Caerostris extrusa TaxID=172846 RepID=A0AAV4NYG0_CAEEX|nr:hypothetical protein CEXT_710211 [Caerostris extrusa]